MHGCTVNPTPPTAKYVSMNYTMYQLHIFYYSAPMLAQNLRITPLITGHNDTWCSRDLSKPPERYNNTVKALQLKHQCPLFGQYLVEMHLYLQIIIRQRCKKNLLCLREFIDDWNKRSFVSTKLPSKISFWFKQTCTYDI